MTTHKPLAMRVAAVLGAALASPASAVAEEAIEVSFKTMYEIQLACGEYGRASGMHSGVIEPAGITFRDLNGDGDDDLIIDHNAITCVRSIGIGQRTCDNSGCALRVFVRSWAGFAFHIERQAASYTISDDELPVITLTDANGTETAMRWDGTYISVVDPGQPERRPPKERGLPRSASP